MEMLLLLHLVQNVIGGRKPEPECNGERIDLLVRLGLLKLPGLAQETFPETLVLNMPRLSAAQGQIQKIVVISTRMCICESMLTEGRLRLTWSSPGNWVKDGRLRC
ncbi:uncharacterized protein [Euphorbia lathyris]|uniref:uncharacterized protein isoform X2 n=1 Tax=Euphorbia lathyris TaxID=212925 RepID=UPI0033136631